MTSLVLNMIVRNEEPIIGDFLHQVRPLIDAWAIMDTGSTDRTMEIIRERLAGIPGRLGQMEWGGFSASRNAAIELAHDLGDYLMFLDADDKVVWTRDSRHIKSQLVASLHPGTLLQGAHQYNRLIFMKNRARSRYRGVIHEVLIPDSSERVGPVVEGLNIERGGIGTSNRSANGSTKYLADAALLEQALLDGTDDDLTERYRFYLAQSYRDCGDVENAIKNYRLRFEMPGGYPQERYVAALNLVALLGNDDATTAEKLMILLRAREIDPYRAEAHHRIAELARLNHMWRLAYEHAIRARDTQTPLDRLFIDRSVSQWRALFEVSVASWHVGEFDEGRVACSRLLSSTHTPAHIKEVTAKNIQHYRN